MPVTLWRGLLACSHVVESVGMAGTLADGARWVEEGREELGTLGDVAAGDEGTAAAGTLADGATGGGEDEAVGWFQLARIDWRESIACS